MNLSKYTVSVFFTTLFVVASFAQGVDNIPQKSEILKKIKLVNDYYLSGHSTPGNNQWVTSIYFTGCMEFYKIYPDKELLNYMNNWGEKNNWALGSSAANHGADQQVCGQTYIDLYNLDEIKNEIKIKAIKESIDDLIKNPTEAKDDWFWVDALYMAMPVFSKLGVLYEDDAYFNQMYSMYQDTKNTRKLYDTTDHLWFRDGNSFKKSPNGKKVFWSRGNGWALAAYARVLRDLPESSPYREEFITSFKEMAEAIKGRQRDDGFWNVNLDDPEHYGGMETSGTALFVYGLSWGINNGLLDKATYLPTILKAWNGLTTYAIQPSGLLGYVQGAGWQPESSQPVTATSTADFGVGAFLLASSEFIKMAPGDMPEPEKPVIDIDVTASDYEAGTENTPDKTLDRQFSTRWSAEGEQWIMFDLRLKKNIASVDIAFYSGDKRKTALSIELSTDGKSFTEVFNGTSSGTTNSWENFPFPPQETRYIRINCNGNTQNKWNSISEVRINDTSEYDTSIETVSKRIVQQLIANGYTDPTLLMNTINEDGSWPDIDYSDTHSLTDGWGPDKHFSNLLVLATAYNHPDCSYYKSPFLLKKIVSGCEYVDRWDYPTDEDNWWWNSIGDPQKYSYTLILIKNDVPAADIKRYSTFIKDDTGNQSHQGQNRAWVSEITFNKGCIENNYNLTFRGFSSMASILQIAKTKFPINGSESKEEGLKSDFSFHQHRRQVQSGSYGLELISTLNNTIILTEGTTFSSAFSSEKRKLFSDMMLNGHMLFSYKKVMDFGVKGRNIARPSDYDMNFIPQELDKMAKYDIEHANIYSKWKQHIEEDVPFPISGNKHFWLSDMMTHHGKDYYLSAKVISSRTNGSESLNGENIKAANLPCGATNIMTTGEEYFNIFPLWNWNRIPGTTSIQKDSFTNLNGYILATNTFAGGISDSFSGILAYQHNYKNVKANKSYFFMDDAMICLGSSIVSSDTAPVATSVNQCFQSGDVFYCDGTNSKKLSDESITSENIKWVYHNNIGYIFPQQVNINIEAKEHTGSWSKITKSGSTETITAPIFSIWLNHGTAPDNATYQYIVAPNKTMQEMDSYAQNTGLEIKKNDSKGQIVYSKTNNQYAIVMYTAGTINLEKGLSLYCDKPCMILLKIKDQKYTISVSDPTYSQQKINISISKTLSGNNAEIALNGNSTNIEFNLPNPNDEYVGSTVTYTYTEEKTTDVSEIETQNKISVYPNPVTETLYIEGTNNDTPIYILNCTGNLIMKTLNKQIKIDSYPKGIYFVKIQDRIFKIIKK